MSLEWLKGILGDSYTDDIDKKISDEIGKSFVSKTDFNSLNETKKTLDQTVKDRDKQLEELKKLNPEKLQEEITRLQTENETQKTNYEAELAKRDYNSAAEKFVDSMNPIDQLSKEAILAKFIAKEFKQEGDNFVGAKEWAEQIMKDNVSHFKSDEGSSNNDNQSSMRVNSGGAHQSANSPDYDKMTDEEYYAAMSKKKE